MAHNNAGHVPAGLPPRLGRHQIRYTRSPSPQAQGLDIQDRENSRGRTRSISPEARIPNYRHYQFGAPPPQPFRADNQVHAYTPYRAQYPMPQPWRPEDIEQHQARHGFYAPLPLTWRPVYHEHEYPQHGISPPQPQTFWSDNRMYYDANHGYRLPYDPYRNVNIWPQQYGQAYGAPQQHFPVMPPQPYRQDMLQAPYQRGIMPQGQAWDARTDPFYQGLQLGQRQQGLQPAPMHQGLQPRPNHEALQPQAHPRDMLPQQQALSPAPHDRGFEPEDHPRNMLPPQHMQAQGPEPLRRGDMPGHHQDVRSPQNGRDLLPARREQARNRRRGLEDRGDRSPDIKSEDEHEDDPPM